MMTQKSEAKHVEPGGGQVFRARGDMFFFKVLGGDSSNGFSMCEVWNEPQGGIPPHIDHRDDEAFFVLEGTYECLLGEQKLTCGPGESFFAPRGTPHAIKNNGDSRARIIIVQSPGGVIEKYMEEAWETIDDPSNPPPPMEPDFDKVMAAAQRHGIEMLRPA